MKVQENDIRINVISNRHTAERSKEHVKWIYIVQDRVYNNPLQRSEFYFKQLHVFWIYIE
jgi:hypothetical protein